MKDIPYLCVPKEGKSKDGTAYIGLARKVAAQSMVLLKNEENILPIQPVDRISIVGTECLNLICGGGGSAYLKCEYIKMLTDGLEEKATEGKLQFQRASVELAELDCGYDLAQLNTLAEYTDKAVITLIRTGTEGNDRLLGQRNQPADDYSKSVGYFYPSQTELALLERLEQSAIQNVILVLNIANTVDLSFIEQFPKIKAVLLSYLPGMDAGTAIADVLCGDVNPSGRLVDTIALDYEDYPSSNYFNKEQRRSVYGEGIFNGYRYFETFAKDRVLYPFGFGLSYTQFAYENCCIHMDTESITVSVDVVNIGEYPGREVVQIYTASPKGTLEKPAIELRGYTKTKELSPGEGVSVEVSFAIADMASFDDTGVTGFPGAWVLEQGMYQIYAGKSARELFSCGEYFIDNTRIAQQCELRFGGNLQTYEVTQFDDALSDEKANWTLYDVESGDCSLADFVNSLTPEELVSLGLGQPIGFPDGTSGVGNLRAKGVPNAQTADGSAGIRRSVNTTFFPCATLVACSWDPQLQYAMGRAMGYEGYSTGIDIVLAPAMNIHRDPLGGRNFEYFSEDPLITGRTAASLIIGMQSEGMCATPKHFALNNCEDYRFISDSVANERTIREIYLKGFEIAIKDANPAFLMTSYNLVNGTHTSASASLLRGILREEWQYEGATMTDWRNGVPMVDEIQAGNNIKMPFGYLDEGQMVLNAYRTEQIPLKVLRENAWYVLRGVMKTRCFVQKDFGPIHKLVGDTLDIPVMKVNGLASSRIRHTTRDDGVEYLYCLSREQRNQRSFVCYAIEVKQAGEFRITAEISTNCPETQIWYFNELGEKLGTAYCGVAVDADKWYPVSTKIYLQEGENVLKMVFANEPYKEYPYFNLCAEIPNAWPEMAEEDISLAKLTLSKFEQT